MNIIFIASDNFNLNDFNDLEDFVVSYPDFQTVFLNNESELKLLLELMDIYESREYQIKGSEFFVKYWNLSDHKLPELNEQQFEQFYQGWINKTERENNMDEYGNLVFIQGLSRKWNKLAHRLIVKEK